MNTFALLIAVITVACAASLVALVDFAMARANDDLRSFVAFEGMHFDERAGGAMDMNADGRSVFRRRPLRRVEVGLRPGGKGLDRYLHYDNQGIS